MALSLISLRHFVLFLLSTLVLSIGFVAISPTAYADTTSDKYGLEVTAGRAELIGDSEGDATRRVTRIVGTIVNVLLGLTGVLFMIQLIFAGELWMTAGGNEESIGKAREMIFNAAVGLLIVLGSYVSVNFAIEVFLGASGIPGPASTS